MEIGIVGLGKMGMSMLEILHYKGFKVTGFDLNKETIKTITEKGIASAHSLEDLVNKMSPSRLLWLMLPAGTPTEETIQILSSLLDKGDIIVDGGNSFYKDSQRRYEYLKNKGIEFLDVGTSGGLFGRDYGYCLMVGGDKYTFDRIEPILNALSCKEGYAYIGKQGTGHFVKMVHNGIEYALLEAYGEGFELIKAKEEFQIDLAKLSHLWNRGSIIRSWLLELAEDAFSKDRELKEIKDYVEDSGEGRWTVYEAIEENIPIPVITLSLLQRLRSREKESFSAKVIAALRNEFGGHSIKANI